MVYPPKPRDLAERLVSIIDELEKLVSDGKLAFSAIDAEQTDVRDDVWKANGLIEEAVDFLEDARGIINGDSPDSARREATDNNAGQALRMEDPYLKSNDPRGQKTPEGGQR